jgi:hypothetical protein
MGELLNLKGCMVGAGETGDGLGRFVFGPLVGLKDGEFVGLDPAL